MDFGDLFVYGGVIVACLTLPLVAVYFTWKGLDKKPEE